MNMKQPRLSRFAPGFCVVLATIVLGCSSQSTVVRSPAPVAANPNASPTAKAVLTYLAGLNSNGFRGAVVGQNCGHGSQIANSSDAFMSYDALVGKLHDSTGKWVGMVGVDYEHDLIFRPEQLTQANAVLMGHWNKGGLVTINWAPQNPWLNDESDLTSNQGTWTNTRNQGTNLANVNLDALVDPTSAIYPVWMRKLDRVAAALAELRDAGVVVLWRPLQEMNGDWFWWGYATRPNDGGPYQRVWQAMFRYFTESKHLDNLLWVYSPANGGSRPASFDYPGDAFVDFVAPTYYGDSLTVQSYDSYLAFNKPLGFAELGTTAKGASDRDGSFDNRRYIDAIRTRYPEVVYFVSWHNWDWGDGTTAHQSLSSNQYAAELLADGNVITAPVPISRP
jgi:mannan endo-1,4-beta-mannosidase